MKKSKPKCDLKISGLTDKGKVREKNEDNFSIDDEIGLFIVSDGVGGHRGGDVASGIVVKAMPLHVRSAIKGIDDIKEIAVAFDKSVRHLSSQLREYTMERLEFRGAGATLVSCLIKDDNIIVAHMGDSRAYLVRNGIMERLTEDHTIVSLLLELGQITKKEAKNHPSQHVITRYVGMDGRQGPDLNLITLRPGDRLLLCSDGLTNMLTEREMGTVLWEEEEIPDACKKLVDMANDAGGKDNITVVVIQYGDKKKKNEKKIRVKRDLKINKIF